MRELPQINKVSFGDVQGRTSYLWTLQRETLLGPMSISIAEYGATMVRCVVPSAAGQATDVVLGYDDLKSYQGGTCYFGAIAGRYGNRLRNSQFSHGGKTHRLVPNEGTNQLHGGPGGFSTCLWEGADSEDGEALTFTLTSSDGDMGFPGELDIKVSFRLSADAHLIVSMEATCDAVTPCNPVQHSYWNLDGHGSGSALGHRAMFNAPFYTPVDHELLATGEIRSVSGTIFDFTSARTIGSGIEGAGYDHNLVLGPLDADGLRLCATVLGSQSGIGLSLRTSEPGVQFYTGGYLSPSILGKGHHPYCAFAGFTLETQKFPGSPEFAHFPSAMLHPGEVYRHVMDFQFFHES